MTQDGKQLDAPWVGARAVLQAPSTPTMSRQNTPESPSGEPVGEGEKGDVASGGVIWEGTTWDACPWPCMCCAPLCCLSTTWKITHDQIHTQSGCCGYTEDTLYINRIKDLSHQSNCCLDMCCCGRGTVVIHCADVSHPELSLTTFGSRYIYKSLQELQHRHHNQHQMVIS